MSTNDTVIPFAYANAVLAGAIAIPVVSAILIGFRFWMRKALKQNLGPDDWTVLAAWPLVTGMSICLIWGVAKKAIGYPSPPYPVKLSSPILEELTETTPEQTVVFIVDWAIWMLMIPGNGLIKISALFLYRRVFVVNNGGYLDIATKVMLVICSLWTIAFWFAQLFGCGANFKNPFGTLEQVASCNTNVRLNGLMISDLITDILVWIMPIVPVWRLNMTISKKLSVTGILLLAAISLAAAIVRLIVQLQITNGGYAAHTDPNLTLTMLLYWSMLESGLALIAACLPTMHLLLIRQSIRSVVYSLRNLLSSQRSGRSTSGVNSEAPYSELSRRTARNGTSKGSQPTQRAKHECYEMDIRLGKASDEESQSHLT